MQLTDDLIFIVSGSPSLKTEIPEDPAHDRVVLELKGVLTKTAADQLGVGWAFLSETTANGGLRDGNLIKDTNLTDIELRIFDANDGSVESFFPDKAYNWKITSLGGGGLCASCKIDIGGNWDRLLDFLRSHRSGFQWTLRPRQKNLFEGGDRVDMSATEDHDIENEEAEESMPEQVSLETMFDDQEPCEHCQGVNAHTDECPIMQSIRAAAAPFDTEPRRGRGRPPGSKNKAKVEQETVA
jgi:hypothetical protein